MVSLIQHTSSAKLAESAGPDYSFVKKLKLGGTGSMKIIHIEGIDFINNFDATSQSQHYLSFEIRPESLIGRTYGKEVKTFLLKKEDLIKAHFETFNLKIASKTGIVIRHEAIIELTLKEGSVKLYVPRNAYKAIKSFFSKDWLQTKSKFTVSSKEPEINYNGLIADIISRLLS